MIRKIFRGFLVSGWIAFFSLLGCERSRERTDTIGNQTPTSDSVKSATVAGVNDTFINATDFEDIHLRPQISLIQVLVNPKQYHGKILCIKGFLRIEPEGNAIFLSENDDRYMILSNAFWVRFNNNAMQMDDEAIAKKFSGKYVRLLGKFDMNNHGHMGIFQGAFADVTQVTIVLDRAEREQRRDLYLPKNKLQQQDTPERK